MGRAPENSELSPKGIKESWKARWPSAVGTLQNTASLKPFWVTFCQGCVIFDFSLGIGTVTVVAGERFLEGFWSALMEFIDFCHCKQYFAFKSDSETLVPESVINS